MAAAPPELVFGTGTHWAFGARHTFPAADNDMWVVGSIPGIIEYGDFVLVDGVTVDVGNFSVADEIATMSVYSTTRGGAAVAHIIGSFTVPAGTDETRFYYPLSIPSVLTTGILINFNLNNAANLDAAYLTAWGHYARTPSTEPQEVTVKGVQFSMPKKKVGPI